jgi:transcriptional regulator with XRE-family HTH domain
MDELEKAKMTFGRTLKIERIRAGYDSQERFAEACDMHRTYEGAIERGQQNLSFGQLWKISKALNMKMSELLEKCGL